MELPCISRALPVFLSSEKEFVIGRRKVEEEGTTEAFLDLARLGGYQMGLSKQHAMIRRAEHGYEVIDLSSRNGTWLNEDQLIPDKPYPFASGSQLRLARMRFNRLYHRCIYEQLRRLQSTETALLTEKKTGVDLCLTVWRVPIFYVCRYCGICSLSGRL